jgi:3-oxoacyl-[acyl-carrier-protein] synthase-3
MLDDLDPRTGLQFGDAATVTLLSERPKWTIGRSDFGTAGVRGRAMEVRMELGGRLHFEENLVRDFALERLPRSVARALELNGLRMADIDRVVLHQGGKALVEELGGKLGVLNKTCFHAAEYGDTGSSSIPIVLEQNLVPTDRRVLISGFGTGLSWATSVLSRAD